MEYSLEGKEYIELNLLIKYIKWAQSGGEANRFVSDGYVRVNKEKEFKRRCKLRAGDVVSFDQENCTVVK
jgi:ribosome-associated protein